jgi:exodeoxyribonuclease V gamma subunit
VTLHVWRSERADGLLVPLADLLAHPLPDPFTPEVVAVPTAGIERWVTQELSLRLGTSTDTTAGPTGDTTGADAIRGDATGEVPGDGDPTDGVCANIAFPFPGKLIADALEAAEGLPEAGDPWSPDRLVWHVVSLFAARPDPQLWGPARSHLAADDGRRYQAARHVAELFDRYAVHRPEMVRRWAAGDDVAPDLQRVEAAHAWQPRLWRALRDALAVPSTAERLALAAHRLAADEVVLDLPERLSVFGLSALPASYLEILAALAGPRDVHLFLRHPSPALWDRIERLHRDQPPRRGPRAQDPTADLPQQPLLRSWGRDAREMQTVFAALGAPVARHQPVPAAGTATDPRPTLLQHLQANLRGDRPAAGAPAEDRTDQRLRLDRSDRSVQVHASHGRLRQVQVLRDAILHLLAGLPGLEPRDIIVMCPDVEAFAPYVDAVFGAQAVSEDIGQGGVPAPTDTPPLRVRIADRSLRQTNPVLKVLAELLDLTDDRLTGPQVFDLLGRTPVRDRFGFTDDDLARIEAWIPDLGIRWGLDADDRDRYDLGGVDANTWRFGLQRLLTGVAVADEELRLVGCTVPYDDVEGSDVELAGRLAECVARLTAVVTGLRTPRTLRSWAAALTDAIQQLCLTSGANVWQEAQLHALLDALVEQAASAADTVPLGLADVRVLLADRLRGRPSRASHRTGDLTFSTLVPMRAVPHRVVCLLGMDDGSFPRQTVPDGDDLIDRTPFVGDRDPRTEDRQLLLDALLAATDHFVVTYSGRDERTNEPLPAAVPVGELLDVVDATVTTGAHNERGQELPARRWIVVEHPLQPFDARNFQPGGLRADGDRDGPWGFDRIALSGARANAGELTEVPAFLTHPLSPREEDQQVVDLGQLVRFLEHPVRFFLGERLGVWLRTGRDVAGDGIPLDLTGLPKWAVGHRLLDALRQGHSRQSWERAERARGTLPPDPLAQTVLDEVCPIVEALVVAADEHFGAAPARSQEVDLPLGDGRRLVGTVGSLHGEVLGLVTYSSLKARHRLAAYARIVALTAFAPETSWRAVLLGRSKRKDPVEVCCLGPLPGDTAGRREEAATRLDTLLDLYDRGLRVPPPLYGDTTEAIARNTALNQGPWGAAKHWETSFAAYPSDDLDPCHVAVLGGVASFDEIMQPPPTPEEAGPEWPMCQQRVVAWARRLWDPVLEVESGAPR